jgi:hypothetical protein
VSKKINKQFEIVHIVDQTNQVLNFLISKNVSFWILSVLKLKEVMRVSREFKCCAGCCWCAGCCNCCAHEITVEAPVGQVIGYVRQKY